eukprot:3941626-Rhodomonas_salina.4
MSSLGTAPRMHKEHAPVCGRCNERVRALVKGAGAACAGARTGRTSQQAVRAARIAQAQASTSSKHAPSLPAETTRRRGGRPVQRPRTGLLGLCTLPEMLRLRAKKWASAHFHSTRLSLHTRWCFSGCPPCVPTRAVSTGQSASRAERLRAAPTCPTARYTL